MYLVSTDMDDDVQHEWSAVLADFAATQIAANLSEKTIQNRSECLLMLARRSGRRPSQITVADMRELLGRRHPRTGERLAQGTMQSERSYMQSFFKWMKSEGYRDDNPAKKLAKVKMTRRRARPLRMDQIDAMLDTGAYARTRDLITIAALTGLRIGEVVKIRGEDIDRVGRTISSIRKGNLYWRGSIPEALMPLVERYPERGWWFPSPYASKKFPEGGGHILMSSASDSISRAIRRAGIVDRNITAHSLRHYLATTMLREGVPIRVVQETLGHASLATTQLYAEVTDEELAAGINRVPAITPRERSGRRGRLAA